MSKAEQFIKDCTRYYSNALASTDYKNVEYHEWLTPEQALRAVEIAREEMIDKACEWLKGHWREYVWLADNNIIHFGHWRNDFKKAMEK